MLKLKEKQKKNLKFGHQHMPQHGLLEHIKKEEVNIVVEKILTKNDRSEESHLKKEDVEEGHQLEDVEEGHQLEDVEDVEEGHLLEDVEEEEVDLVLN